MKKCYSGKMAFYIEKIPCKYAINGPESVCCWQCGGKFWHTSGVSWHVYRYIQNNSWLAAELLWEGIIFRMCPDNERPRYIVTSSFIGCVHI